MTAGESARQDSPMGHDDVIDLDRYREESRGGSGAGVSLHGADGEHRHFALPLWRMASVSGARWAGLVRHGGGDDPPVAVTAVDLAAGGPREAPPGGLPGPEVRRPPHLAEHSDGRVVLPVGGFGGAAWSVVLGDRSRGPLGPGIREDLLFLAGECAGLLAVLGRGTGGGPLT